MEAIPPIVYTVLVGK